MRLVNNGYILIGALLVGLSGCFGGTIGQDINSGDIDAATSCIDRADPPNRRETMQVGQIETGRFETLFPRQDIYLVYGPQGGHHIDISVRFFSEQEGRWHHDVELVDLTNDEIVGTGEAVFDACDRGWSQTDYIRIHVIPTGWVDCRIDIKTEARDGQTGGVIRDSVQVQVQSPQT